MRGQLVVDIVVPELKRGLVVKAVDGPTIGDGEWTKK